MAAAHKLELAHRQVIQRLWEQGKSMAEIADAVGVTQGALYREVERNNSYRHGTKHPHGAVWKGLYRWGYTAERAQAHADQRRRRPKQPKLARPSPLRDEVVRKLADTFSPRQVAMRLRREYPDQPEMHVSHETIYQAIFLQSRGGLRELVDDHLRVTRNARRSQSRAAQTARGALRNKPWVTEQVNISQRPAEADDRAVPGHWEGDLVIGKAGKSAIVTLVERTTRFVMLGELPIDRTSPEVLQVVRRLFARMPDHMVASLTWDCGSELAEHADFTLATDIPIYLCDPHSPWQRGSNENTNGLLRFYFPKGKFDFTTIGQDRLDEVAAQLNRRPRDTLNWDTPAERLDQLLHARTG
jgi:transposase, IS30 family